MNFRPWQQYHRLWQIDPAQLYQNGVRMVLLDMDNTLVPWRTLQVPAQIEAWVQRLQAAGIKAVLYTNNTPKRTVPLAAQLGIAYLHSALKPWPMGLLRLRRAHRDFCAQHTVLIGDQLFTDILTGKLWGLRTILVEPLSPHDNRWTRFMRRIERHVRNQQGI